MDLQLPVAPFALLAESTLEELLTIAPALLAQQTGQDQAQVERLLRSLRTLRLLSDLTFFRTLRLVDLIT